jgi:hypothetical protein
MHDKEAGLNMSGIISQLQKALADQQNEGISLRYSIKTDWVEQELVQQDDSIAC